jgi:aminoglycoside phosphotransferase family enzyme/predicted kinase
LSSQLYKLIESLRQEGEFGPASDAFQLIDTHISYVLLTGQYAYKFKKPVDFGFLDFSTLERRQFFCEEELRLNKRLAPDLYLDVVPITGSADVPRLGGTGPAIEYCVRMRQFSPQNQLDLVLQRNALTSRHVDALAELIARFHQAIPAAGPNSEFGSPAVVRKHALENFDQIGGGPDSCADKCQELRAWTDAEHSRLHGRLADRKRTGRVRECHGDMHLTNMALVEDGVVVFDCIEFNPALYWIDVMSDIAFLLMDLDHRGYPELGYQFLNRYLEITGDYSGLALLDFYRVYRSMVRAKVAHLQWPEPAAARRFSEHVELAGRYIQEKRKPALIIMHGLSGTGKSWISAALAARLGAIRVRSDVERKRLVDLPAEARTSSGLGDALYSGDSTARTYARLLELARDLLVLGFPVILDATFLKRRQRSACAHLAQDLHVPYAILNVQASDEVLRERLARRSALANDPSEADLEVLEHQIATQEPLAAEERDHAITVDGGKPVDVNALAQRLTRAIFSIISIRAP